MYSLCQNLSRSLISSVDLVTVSTAWISYNWPLMVNTDFFYCFYLVLSYTLNEEDQRSLK